MLLVDARFGAQVRRWPRRLVTGALVALALLLLAIGLFARMTRIAPPPITDDVAAAAERPVEVRGARAYVGANWMSRERGVWEIHLEGEPYAMGWAQGRLGERLLGETEEYMFGEMARYVPSRLAL